MTINYPGSKYNPMTDSYLWTMYHPCALFNANSLFHRIRAQIDHRVVLYNYFRHCRDNGLFLPDGNFIIPE